MEYAVIRTGGKQYRVKRGDVFEVDKLPFDRDSPITFGDVLLWVADGQVKIGTPTVANVKVIAKVIDQIKGEKIRVAKFKSKVRYRRVAGFRAQLTRVQIEKIDSGKTLKVKEATLSTIPSHTPNTKSTPAAKNALVKKRISSKTI